MTAAAANATKSFIQGSRQVFMLQAGKHAYQGATACGSHTLGVCIPATASASLVTLGVFDREIDNTNGTAATPVVVDRLATRTQLWRANDGSITSANVFQSCYNIDDLTVGITGSSVAGTIMRVSATEGVLFELAGV